MSLEQLSRRNLEADRRRARSRARRPRTLGRRRDACCSKRGRRPARADAGRRRRAPRGQGRPRHLRRLPEHELHERLLRRLLATAASRATRTTPTPTTIRWRRSSRRDAKPSRAAPPSSASRAASIPSKDHTHYREILTALKAAFPQRPHPRLLARRDRLTATRRAAWRSPTTSRWLKDAGLGTIPGTAAEILDDEIRQVIEPRKLGTARWIEIVEAAHGVGLRSTATVMYGHVEKPRHVAAPPGHRSARSRSARAASPSSCRSASSTRRTASSSTCTRAPARRGPRTCASSPSRVCSCGRGSRTSRCRG